MSDPIYGDEGKECRADGTRQCPLCDSSNVNVQKMSTRPMDCEDCGWVRDGWYRCSECFTMQKESGGLVECDHDEDKRLSAEEIVEAYELSVRECQEKF